MEETLYTVVRDFRHVVCPCLSQRLSEDLGFDAIDRLLFMMALEAEAGIALSPSDAASCISAATLSEVLSLLRKYAPPVNRSAPSPHILQVPATGGWERV